MFYIFDQKTKEFLRQTQGQKNPLAEGQFLTPPFSTKKQPPAAADNEVAVFNVTSDVWSIVSDYRGWTGFDRDGNEQKIDQLNVSPESDWSVTKPFILADAQNIKKNEIRAAFGSVISTPVAVNGVNWNGGYDAALKKDAAKRMAALAGQNSVTLFDIDNGGHDLVFADADAVILGIGAVYQAAFALKQSLMVAVDALPDDAVQADIDAIVVSF